MKTIIFGIESEPKFECFDNIRVFRVFSHPVINLPPNFCHDFNAVQSSLVQLKLLSTVVHVFYLLPDFLELFNLALD